MADDTLTADELRALAYRFTQASSRPMCSAAASRPHQRAGCWEAFDG